MQCTNLSNVLDKALKQDPDMFLCECLLIVHFSVNVAVVEKVDIDLLDLLQVDIPHKVT